LPPRKIIHLDLDAFFCAVEELRDPSLVGKPFAVGGRPEERGVVASCSYAARGFGIRSAMPMSRALHLCPGLLIISSRHGIYGDISDQVMAILLDHTSLLEQISIDEAFLDVSELSESGEQTARSLQTEIYEKLRLPCSLGVASNKLVAKIATDVGKAGAKGSGPPRAITIVPPGQERAFLAPLPVLALWGVGPKTAARLEALSISTIGDLASQSETEMIRLFGKNGHEMALHARGIDDRPIVTSHDVKSISQEITYARDVSREEVLRRTVLELSGGVGYRVRKSSLFFTTVKIKVRWSDFTTLTRQVTLSEPTDQDQAISEAAWTLFKNVWSSGRLVRLVGVGVSGLVLTKGQLSFWDGPSEKGRRLQGAVDSLRDRYGRASVQRGSDLEKKKS
jgi:DNA polymerase-4